MEIKKTYLLSAIFAVSLLAGCASTGNSDSDSAGSSASAEQQAADRAAAQRAADAEAARLAAEAEAAKLKTIFHFDFDQTTLTAAARADLDAQIAVLKSSTSKIRLEGHADERGTREYNIALGERRANAVANYIVINGIARYRIEAVSYGEESPARSGNHEEAWSENRRVELK